MTGSPFARRRSVFSALLCLALAATGCASNPKHPVPAPVAKPTAAPPPDTVRMAPIPNPQEPPPPRPARHAPTWGASARSSGAKLPARAPAPVAVNPARAAQLRAAGLEQLQRGAINRAVSLLQQANRLDPENPLIQRDLERAVRISRAVAAKH